MTADVVRLVVPDVAQIEQAAGIRWDDQSARGFAVALSRAEFVDHFRRWWSDHSHSHLGLVGLVDEQVVACGFLALVPRMPSAHRPDRLTVDIQFVHVVAGLRDRGIGARLLDRLVDLAREQGAERITVHSSERAVTAYARSGFLVDPLLLNQHLKR